MVAQRIKKSALLNILPSEWPASLLPAIRTQITTYGRKLVVLDDDPTGTQTVYDIPVLTTWAVADVVQRLRLEGGG